MPEIPAPKGWGRRIKSSSLSPVIYQVWGQPELHGAKGKGAVEEGKGRQEENNYQSSVTTRTHILNRCPGMELSQIIYSSARWALLILVLQVRHSQIQEVYIIQLSDRAHRKPQIYLDRKFTGQLFTKTNFWWNINLLFMALIITCLFLTH